MEWKTRFFLLLVATLWLHFASPLPNNSREYLHVAASVMEGLLPNASEATEPPATKQTPTVGPQVLVPLVPTATEPQHQQQPESPVMDPLQPVLAPILIVHDGAWEKEWLLHEVFPLSLYPNRVFASHRDKITATMQQLAAELARIPPQHRVLALTAPRRTCLRSPKWMAQLSPAVVFVFSDEFGRGYCHHNFFGRAANLTFRQYMPGKTGYHNFPHGMFRLPLPWLPKTFDPETYSRAALLPASQRPYAWSFVGNIKSDRRQMLAAMAAIQPSPPRTTQTLGRREMGALYANSSFVPVGRGWTRLDCCRIYEAAKAGAIPIVVGPWQEIVESFSHFFDVVEPPANRTNRLPPWLFAESWPDAVRKAKELLGDAVQLDQRQRQVLDFNEDINANVRYATHSQLSAEEPRRYEARADVIAPWRAQQWR